MCASTWHLERDTPVRFMHGSMCVRPTLMKKFPARNKHTMRNIAGRTNNHPEHAPITLKDPVRVIFGLIPRGCDASLPEL